MSAFPSPENSDITLTFDIRFDQEKGPRRRSSIAADVLRNNVNAK